MRWIASFFATSLVVIVITAILWFRDNPILGTSVVADALNWAIPDGIVLAIRRSQIPAAFGLWALLRIAFQWLIAYSGSQTDASPRNEVTLNRLSAFVFKHFHNPARWWLAPYLGLLTFGMGVIGAYIWIFDNSIITRSAWLISSLLVATLTAMMINVDKFDGLAGPDSSDPDPVLLVQDE